MPPRPPAPAAAPASPEECDAWRVLVEAAHGDAPLAALPEHPLSRLFAPLLARPEGRPLVFAHLAQSLDGRIALPNGEAFWITGAEDIRHSHRLRAWSDAVVVGAETAVRDDPRLTVRDVPGPQPLRVVIDPRGRVSADAAVCRGGPPTLLFRKGGPHRLGDAEVLCLPEAAFTVAGVLDALAARGVRRVLVEGGGVTVSRFLEAGLLDRLHLVVAPVLLGRGRPSLDLVLGGLPAACPRPVAQVVPLGVDQLYDLDLCALGGVPA